MIARSLTCLALLAIATAALGEEKKLYKCRAPDGSTAFQEDPCAGAALDVIPIAPGGTPPPLKLTEPACITMARDLWDLNGTVEHTDFSEAGRRLHRERTQSLRTQCGAVLERSQLAIECAVLRGALAVTASEPGSEIERVRAQHAEQCAPAAIDADIRKHVHAAEAS